MIHAFEYISHRFGEIFILFIPNKYIKGTRKNISIFKLFGKKISRNNSPIRK